jgi:WD40 repeat protein
MSAIFISHSSTDAAVAAELRNWLRGIGHRSLFLDFDPEDGIPAGRRWEHELYHQLRVCRAVIVLCSRQSMASRWCFAEIMQARSMGKALLPVRIDDCTIDAVVTDHQCIDMTTDKEAAYERLGSGLLAAGLDPEAAFDWDGSRPPYPGLLSFREDDAAVFFGRDEEIGTGLDLLNKVRRLGTADLVIVLGASGSGKSSLVNAGLVPRLRRDAERWLVVDPFRPGNDPVEQMAGAISRSFARLGEKRERVGVRDEIRRALGAYAPDLPNPLAETARELRFLANRPEATTLLIVDQFEELLDRPTDHPSTGVLKLLRGAAEPSDSRVVVLATMRSDFLAKFQDTPSLIDLPYESLPVGPLSPSDISQIIEQPARIAGVDVEPGLVQAMIADCEGGDALPLLAFILRELYERTDTAGRMDVAAYRHLGGLHGAVARVADEVVEAAELEPAQPNELRLALLTMVRLTDDDRWVRRVGAWDDIPESIHPVLERLVTARLLISGGVSETRTIEVCHEALFRSWGRLVAWLDQNIELLRLRRDLHQSARNWDVGGRDPGDLWRGVRLGRASELAGSGDLPLEDVDREFVDASEQARRAQERSEELRKQRTRRARVGVAVVALLIAVAVMLLIARASNEAERADEQERSTTALSLATSARNLLETNPALALAVAAESADITDTPLPQATDALVRARVAFARRPAQQRVPLGGNDGDVVGVRFSRNGKQLASITGDDRTMVRLWDTTTGDSIGNPLIHESGVMDVRFSPDGEQLTSTTEDGTVRWDTATGVSHDRTLRLHDGDVPVAYSADGTRLVLAARDGMLWLGDPTTGDRLGEPLEVQLDDVMNLAFSADDTRLVVAEDETVRSWGWDPTTGRLIGEGHTFLFGEERDDWIGFGSDGTQLAFATGDGSLLLRDATTGNVVDEVLTEDSFGMVWVVFSPDGARMAALSDEPRAEVQLWDREMHSLEASLAGHTGRVNDVAFSPDGKLLATAGADDIVLLWTLGNGDPIEDLVTDEADTLYGVAFSPDGSLMASASIDGSLQLWDPSTRRPVGTALTSQDDSPVSAVAFSPDGKLLAAALTNGTVQLWDPASREPIGTPLASRDDSSVSAVAFSPDGKLLAAALANGTVQLWDPASREPIGTPLTGHNSSLYGLSVAFSPDGKLLASAGDDGTVRLWDPATGERSGEPLAGDNGTVVGVAFSPDGKLLASAGDDGSVRLWDPATGLSIGAPLVGHEGTVTAVVFSPDGRVLASAGVDGAVRLWDPATGSPIGPPLGDGSSVFAIAFRPDSRLLASAGGELRLWAPVWDLDEVCKLVGPFVSAAQVQAYLPPDRHPRACPLT